MALIDAGIGAAAESLGVDMPPSAPAIGQCWILGDAPTGAWTGHARALACWTQSGWRFLPGIEGMIVWLRDQRLWAVCEDGGWVAGTVRAASVAVDDVQVLGPRGPAVPASTGGAVIDAEARSTIAAIIDRLVTHGLIEP